MSDESRKIINGVENLTRILEEKSNNKQSEFTARNVLLDEGIKNDEFITRLLKLKYGKFNTITLSLDGVNDEPVEFVFRTLTSDETSQIEKEMLKFAMDNKTDPLSIAYNIHFVAKTLSKASDVDVNMHHQALKLTEREVLQFPFHVLLALGKKYNAFREKHAPALEDFTEEDFKQIIDRLHKCEGNLGKMMQSLSGLNLSQTQNLVMYLTESYSGLMKQLDSLSIK